MCSVLPEGVKKEFLPASAILGKVYCLSIASFDFSRYLIERQKFFQPAGKAEQQQPPARPARTNNKKTAPEAYPLLPGLFVFIYAI